MIIAIPADPYSLPDSTPTHQISTAAIAFYNANSLDKSIVNAGTTWPILLTAKGRKHVTQPRSQAVLLRALAAIEDAIEHASLSTSVADKRNRPDIVAVHRFEISFADGSTGRVLPAQIVVFEQLEAKKIVYRFYDLAFLAQ